MSSPEERPSALDPLGWARHGYHFLGAVPTLLPARWPWQRAFVEALERIRALPALG